MINDDKRLEIFFANKRGEAPHVQEKVEAFLRANQISEALINKFLLSTDELVTNVISYAYDDDKEHAVSLLCNIVNDSVVVLELRDDGRAFDPTGKSTPNPPVSIEDQGIGGMGIHLAKTLMDQVEYEREGDYNVLRIYKNRIPSFVYGFVLHYVIIHVMIFWKVLF